MPKQNHEEMRLNPSSNRFARVDEVWRCFILRIGFHVSISGGLSRAVQRARESHCQTIQIFSAGPSQWARRKHKPDEDAVFVDELLRHDIQPLFVHAPYLLNLATPDQVLWEKSVKALAEDLGSASLWAARGVVIHLGSRGETERSATANRIASAIMEARDRAASATKVILENSAGAGHLVGRTMSEIGEIIDKTGGKNVGVCIDTCHAFAGGYAVHTRTGLSRLLDEIDSEFGSEFVNIIHLNDSKAPLGSHIDRHEHIGQGQIGLDGMHLILSEPRLRHLPFIMETPKSSNGTPDADLANLRTAHRLIPSDLRPTPPLL